MRHEDDRRMPRCEAKIRPVLAEIIYRFGRLWSGTDQQALIDAVLTAQLTELITWHRQFCSPIMMALKIAEEIGPSSNDGSDGFSGCDLPLPDYDFDNLYLNDICREGQLLLARVNESQYLKRWIWHEETCRICTDATAYALASQLIDVILGVHRSRYLVALPGPERALYAAEDLLWSSTLSVDERRWFFEIRREYIDD